MSGFVRRKRVTDPLDDEAKARLVGCQLSFTSSGSEHSGDLDDDDSPCLSELVYGFLEVDGDIETQIGCDSDSDQLGDDSDNNCTEIGVISDILRSIDWFRNLLFAHVIKAMEICSMWRDEKAVLRRKVTSFLRELGHNAGVCKTKWDASGGLNAGNYEFIDVVVSTTSQNSVRYIIDLDFASQFEIARQTSQYEKIVQSLPRVFIGKSDELKTIIKVMCDAARRSLKTKHLSLPPWRKNRYMQNKWLGPYRRTLNQLAVGGGGSAAPVNCRLVGFDDAANGRVIVRTR